MSGLRVLGGAAPVPRRAIVGTDAVAAFPCPGGAPTPKNRAGSIHAI
jgi:hypothetical protein